MANLSITGQDVIPTIPSTTAGIGGRAIYKDDVSNFDCEENATYQFKVEEQVSLEYVSVDMIAVRYLNIGLGELIVSLIGPTDTQTQTLILGDSTKTKGYYNGGTVPKANANGKSYTAFFSFHSLTDESFQVQLTRPASSGPLAIEKVTIFGTVKEKSR